MTSIVGGDENIMNVLLKVKYSYILVCIRKFISNFEITKKKKVSDAFICPIYMQDLMCF